MGGMLYPVRPNVVDMYHGDNHETVPDFARMKAAGVMAVIHKIGQGDMQDHCLMARSKAAHDADMPMFGYWFGDGSLSASDQAKRALQWGLNDAGLLGISLDWETYRPQMSIQMAATFLTIADTLTQSRVPIYSSNTLREQLQIYHDTDFVKLFGSRMLWLAEYGPHENLPAPWTDPRNVLWQYSDAGGVAGISGHVDANFWPGDLQDLLNAWHGIHGAPTNDGAMA